MSNEASRAGAVAKFEVNRQRLFRQHRSSDQRLQGFIKQYAWMILLACILIALFMPATTVVVAVIYAVVFIGWLPVKSTSWLLREPVYEASGGDESEKGILYLGNATTAENKALWFSKTDLTTHALVLGMTGSGKTQLLLSMMNQFVAMGSGFIFCDGKGDVTTWFHLHAIAKSLGLEDNITVINFLTAGKSDVGKSAKLSNTLNPFSTGSSDSLMEMLSGFMGSSDGDSSMWRGRAEALGRCLLRALCELRDKGDLVLSVDTIRASLPLMKLEKLSQYPGLSTAAKKGIHYYLNELPGWKAYKEALKLNTPEGNAAALESQKTAFEQHAYLTMQFTKTLEILASTYAHITKTDLAEVDFKDIITNRRMLYIMLPSLEKSPESLKDLGRMVVTNIRNALAGLLGGDELAGEKQFLLDAKPTHASTPFGIFLDEYGSYAVEGFGDIGAQARSLNISVWFAGQEFDSFEKGSKIEAARILSNTGIKIFMKTESEATARIANQRTDQVYAYAANQVEADDDSLFDRTLETGSYSLQKVDRIMKEDLTKQKTGECHVFFGANLWQVKSFYGDFKLPERTHINHFVKLKPQKNTNQKTTACSPLAAEQWAAESKKVTHPNKMSPELVGFLNTKQDVTEEAN